MGTILMKITLTERQKQQLRELGFKEEEITPETLVNVRLYQEALNGNVSAANSIKATLNQKEDEEPESIEDLTKEVKKEEEKIRKQLEGLSPEILNINGELIHNVTFQSVQLRHLSNYIAIHGVKEKYKNGNNQWGWKDRTEVKTYNNMMKSYQSCMKQLNDLMSNNYVGTNSLEEFDLSD